MSESDSNAEAEVPANRWTRRATDEPRSDGSSSGGSDRSDNLAASDQFASLAERAARLAPSAPVSVRRIAEPIGEPRGEPAPAVGEALAAPGAIPDVPEVPAAPDDVILEEDSLYVEADTDAADPEAVEPEERAEGTAPEPPAPEPPALEPPALEPPTQDEVFPQSTANLALTVTPLQHAMLPAVFEPDPEPERNRTALALLAIAAGLAVLCGILGLLWLRERSNSENLTNRIAEVTATDEVTDQGLESLNDEVRTLRLQNDQLQQQLNDMSALVLELPEGRVTEIAVPFTPIFADEENGRLIAIGESGEYITWGEGADGPITDTGTVSGAPTGLFAATRKAWISTDAGRIDVLSLVAGEPGLASVEFGPSLFMAAEDRGYWTYNSASSEVVRLKKSDGGITASVSVPVPIIDLTIGAGSVWALGDDGRVYRINTADLTVQAFDAGEDLIAVTAGPDALWTLSAADGSLRRVDPVTGEVLVTVPVGRDPIDATFAGSSVWVALRSGSSLIEVDTRTSAVVSRTSLPSEPTALHQGDSGVFVTTAGDVPLLRVASLTPIEVEPSEDTETEEGS